MNKALRQLFTAVVALFVVLGLSTTIITAIKADDLNADSRNTRMLYHTHRRAPWRDPGLRRHRTGPIRPGQRPILLPADLQQRTGLRARHRILLHHARPWTAASRRRATNSSTARPIPCSGSSSRTPSPATNRRRVGGDLHRPHAAAARLPAAGRQGGRHHSQRPQNRAHPGHGQHPQLRSEPAGRARRRPSQPGLHRPGLPADQPHAQPGHLPAVPAGSTFKVIVAAAALESGDYQPDTEIPAGASYTLPGTSTDLTNATAAGNGTDGKITLAGRPGAIIEHRLRPARRHPRRGFHPGYGRTARLRRPDPHRRLHRHRIAHLRCGVQLPRGPDRRSAGPRLDRPGGHAVPRRCRT